MYCKLVENRNSTKLYLFSCTIGTIRNLYDNIKKVYYINIVSPSILDPMWMQYYEKN